MSQARIQYVQRAQARYPKGDDGKPDRSADPIPLTCERDGTLINKGEPYRWFKVGFRSNYKHIRCMKPECTPRPSELESSNLATAYAAQEDALDSANSVDNPDDAQQVVDEFSSALQELAEEYRTASENPNTGVVFNTDAEERADTLESAAGELDGFDPPELPEPCPDHPEGSSNCDSCTGILEDYVEELREATRAAINEVSF